MVAIKAIGISALVSVASATVAPNFPVSATPDLNVTFGTNNVSPPGELLPRADTASAPNVSTPVTLTGGRGVVFIIDQDVPSNGARVQRLHYLASNVSVAANNSTLILPTGETPYAQPNPPAGDSAHAYNLLLFVQPANFSIPAAYASVITARQPFDIAAFASAARLGSPIAANYFRVQNTSAPLSSTSVPPPASSPTGAVVVVSSSSRPASVSAAATSSRAGNATTSAVSTTRAASATTTRPATFTGAANAVSVFGAGALLAGAMAVVL